MGRDANDVLREDGEEVVLDQLDGAAPIDPALAKFTDAPVTQCAVKELGLRIVGRGRWK